MLQIVDIYQQRYHESERAYKHIIVEEVLHIIHRSGGRFLERSMMTTNTNTESLDTTVCNSNSNSSSAVDDHKTGSADVVDDSCWEQVSHIKAYRKVGHAFRSCKRKVAVSFVSK